MQKGVTKALVNSALVMPAGFTRNPDLVFPRGSMEREIEDAVGAGDAEFLDATKLATGLMGDSIATNLFMVGYAYQRGLLPLSEAAILRAIELNGAAIEVEQAELRLGPARGGRSGARVGGGDSSGRSRIAADVRIARRNGRAPAEVPDRLPGCRVCCALHRLRRQGPRRREHEGSRRDDADRSGRALLLQAAGGQGRIRGRAPVHRRRIREAGRRAVRRRLQAQVPSRAAGVQQARSAHRRGEEERLRAVDDGRVPRARENARAARHGARRLRAHGGAQAGARAPRPVRNARRRARRRARAAQPRTRGAARADSRAHPRLRPRQGPAPEAREGEGGGAPRRVSCARPETPRERTKVAA